MMTENPTRKIRGKAMSKSTGIPWQVEGPEDSWRL